MDSEASFFNELGNSTVSFTSDIFAMIIVHLRGRVSEGCLMTLVASIGLFPLGGKTASQSLKPVQKKCIGFAF